MDESAVKIKKYIEEISLIQEKDKNDLQSLIKCRKEYNFSDEESEILKKLSMSHQTRSEELLKSGKLNGAAVSMERAVEINPFSDEFRNKLAQLYLMRAQKEGYKKTDRDLAYKSAALSLKLNSSNPIAKSILKGIQQKEDKISGKELHKKMIPLILAIVTLALLALFMEKEYVIPFFDTTSSSESEEWIKPASMEKIPFTERKISTQINRQNDQFNISITKSIIEKTNGSFSYTIQGDIIAEEAAVKSLDLEINFIDMNKELLFKKIFSLVKDTQIVMPGETILIDHFFYIHYLPPEIDKITLNLKDISFTEENLPHEDSHVINIEWKTPRPEGIKISMYMKDEKSFETYAQYFKNMKIQLKNNGIVDLHNLDVILSWRDKYGSILYQSQKMLINEKNPPLLKEEERIFYLFSEIPQSIDEKNSEFYIRINRIN